MLTDAQSTQGGTVPIPTSGVSLDGQRGLGDRAASWRRIRWRAPPWALPSTLWLCWGRGERKDQGTGHRRFPRKALKEPTAPRRLARDLCHIFRLGLGRPHILRSPDSHKALFGSLSPSTPLRSGQRA